MSAAGLSFAAGRVMKPCSPLSRRRPHLALLVCALAFACSAATAGNVATVAVEALALPVPAQRAPVMPADLGKLVRWVADSGDNGRDNFVVVDKPRARLWVFDAQRRVLGVTPVLLGLASGDASVPGIGDRPMHLIQPHERTTPAGRFVAEPGRNTGGEDIVWVDYDAAVSMHRVRATNPVERRLQRLATPTVADNRISYGCINVPAAFYDRYVKPAVGQRGGIVYVLPDEQPLAAVFPALR